MAAAAKPYPVGPAPLPSVRLNATEGEIVHGSVGGDFRKVFKATLESGERSASLVLESG